MFYQILRHLGMEMCDTIAGGRVEAISDKEWNLTWWMHYGCFLLIVIIVIFFGDPVGALVGCMVDGYL